MLLSSSRNQDSFFELSCCRFALKNVVSPGSHGRISETRRGPREGRGQTERTCGKTDALPMARALVDRDGHRDEAYQTTSAPNHDHSLGSTGTDKSGRRSRPAHPQTPPVAEKTIRKKTSSSVRSRGIISQSGQSKSPPNSIAHANFSSLLFIFLRNKCGSRRIARTFI